ncbi:MAG: MFS transporter [Proteobacteria bacterium]|nr:MFS transporter [Pseudomonadota bacterium]
MAASRAQQLALIGLGVAIVPFDSAVNIAFPAITRGFDLAIAEIQWVVISYVLTYASLMLVFGRIGDMFGHARVFRVGLVWSAIACLLCASAGSLAWLIVARVLQGVGAALVLSCGVALSTGLYNESRRGRVIGTYTMMMALAGATAPWLGGFLVEAWDWPAVFWFRIPFVLAALVFLRDLPAPPRQAVRETFDVVGAVLLVLALSALLATLNNARSLTALPLGALALVALIGFVRQESRVAHPILDLTVFRVPGFAVLNLVSVLVNLAAFAVWLLVPYFLRTAAEFSFATGGGVLATSAIGTMVASSIGGRLLGRVPARWMAVAGAGLVAVGQTLVGSIWQPDTPVLVLLATLLVQGSGLGLFQIAYTEIVTATIPRQNRGVAGSLVMVTRTLGVISAASMLGLLFQGLAADLGFMAAFQRTFWLAALLALTMAGLVAVGVRR